MDKRKIYCNILSEIFSFDFLLSFLYQKNLRQFTLYFSNLFVKFTLFYLQIVRPIGLDEFRPFYVSIKLNTKRS